ncbi:hypothetical protein [Vibrio phage RYC]|nr:hypothetical protein [Vibrio phage RYC]
MFKSILAIATLSLTMVSIDANATVTEHYAVKGNISTKVAPTSGLVKASCKFLNKKGERVAGQNVTVIESFDDITIIEANLYTEQHAVITQVECL